MPVVIQSITPNGIDDDGPAPGMPLVITGSGLSGGSVTISRRVGTVDVEAVCEKVGADQAARIEVRMPGTARFWPTTGTATVRVTVGGESGTGHVSLGGRPSVTTWARLEPRARFEDLELAIQAGLEAPVHDAAWMLARQWQVGEFTGEDGGSPVIARVAAEAGPIARYAVNRPAPLTVEPFDPRAMPLEAAVERERARASVQARIDRRVDGGLHFLRILRERLRNAARANVYRTRYLEVYALAPPAELDDETARYADVIARRVIDADRLAADLRSAPSGTLPPRPKVDPPDSSAIKQAAAEWLRWYDALVSETAAGASAWNPERLEYSFKVGADLGGREVVLAAPEHACGLLDWHSFVVEPGSVLRDPRTPAAPTVPVSAAVIPAALRFAGMPASRWWELEDAAVDFGTANVGAADLARMVFIEYATACSNDWFVIPLAGVPVGSLLQVKSFSVVDTFGNASNVGALSAATTGAFRLFELTQEGAPNGGTSAGMFFLPPVVATLCEGEPVEEVVAARDEVGNVAWAIERAVESPAGRRVMREAPPGSAVPPPSQGVPRYRVADFPPPNWMPLVPDMAARRLTLGATLHQRPDGTLHPNVPAGALLEPPAPGQPLRIHDAEIPLSGLRLTRTYRYARWVGGSTHLWVGREKRAAIVEVTSGLRFDRLEP